VTYLGNVAAQPVRGFGIVVGLGDKGSGDCPTAIRQYLVESMMKVRETWASLEERRRFSPDELIESRSTAVVEVLGVVPPGARKGTTFDLLVRAIPGTATQSLAGGLLLPCELHLPGPTGTQEELLGTQVVARAAGPVFIDPFGGGDREGGKGDPRRGLVLGGGQTLDSRNLRLVLREPSYPLARRLENRINERFGQRPPTSEAMSRGYLNVQLAEAYATERDRFIRLLPYLYLESHPAFIETQLRELSRLVTAPGADYERIALAWEGIGRTALPHIQPLYSHATPQIRYYAARVGLRLEDVTALPVLAELAAGSDRALALPAIYELGRCRLPAAALALRPLLDSPDRQVRLAAYGALLNHPEQPGVSSQRFPHPLDPMQLNLVLDLVESSGDPLIYVSRTRMPRIAVFARELPLVLPMFYSDADDTVTLTAADSSGDITVFIKRRGKLSDPILVAPRVVDLIAALADRPTMDNLGRPRGAGLPYSEVVQILSALCRDGTIPAELEVEPISLADLLGPAARPERPETDEPAESQVPQPPSAPDHAPGQ